MKAIFKKTVYDRLMEIIVKAERERKTIDYILVTPQEWEEFRASPYSHYSYNPYPTGLTAQADTLIFKTLDLNCTNDPYRHRARRFIVEPFLFNGYQIVVAPIEYHPV
jgi:hypothetical protein